jgi:prevent-host-death family protein
MYKTSCTVERVTKRYGIADARRRLPELVRSVATGGGRIDITYRGKPQVALLRVSDVKDGPVRGRNPWLDPALQGELRIPGGDLIAAIREVRRGLDVPRTSSVDPQEGSAPAMERRPQTPRMRRRRGQGA